MLKERHINYSIGLVVFLTIYFIFFQHLDSFHIRNWDESMFAVNAYEMSNNYNFIVPYYKNVPDMWNSKPPFQIWAQVFFIKLISFNELAIRLPSALASSFSALVLFFFFKKRTNMHLALCVFFVFVTCSGVSAFHTGRTGDSDALLSFFMLCYCLEFYKWLFENNQKSLLLFFVFLTCAFLTKSIAALLFIPALIFLAFYFKKTQSVLTTKTFYIGLIFFITISLGYFLLRNYYNNGYIDYVIGNDIGRISTVIESHKEPFDFYFNNLFEYRFLWIILVLPGAFTMLLFNKTKTAGIFMIALLITYFAIISYSTTKLQWYDLPLFPILSVFSAFFIYLCVSRINKKIISPYYSLFFIFILPVYFSARTSYKSEIDQNEKKHEILTEYAFKNIKNNSLNNTTFLVGDYDRALYFYKYKLNSKGMDFNISHTIDAIKVNNTVIVANDSLKSALSAKFNIQITDSLNSAVRLIILSAK